MKRIAFYHQCGGCNQITEITPLNPWSKYYTMPIIICNGQNCYNQQMYTVWLYEPKKEPNV